MYKGHLKIETNNQKIPENNSPIETDLKVVLGIEHGTS